MNIKITYYKLLGVSPHMKCILLVVIIVNMKLRFPYPHAQQAFLIFI